jgi:dienelactone hydrolase
MTPRTERGGLLRSALLIAAAVAAITSPSAADVVVPDLPAVVQPRGLTRELVSVPFSPPNGPTLRLKAIVVRPAASGRFPLVLISHGSPRRIAEAKKRDLDWADWIADDFARRGWAAATVLRRGYGASEGAVADSYGTCNEPDYRAAGLTSAQDIVQAVRYFQKQPYVDPTRVLLIGVSAGGFGSIAAASLAPAGLVAVVNFAGGRGSVSADVVCKPDELVEAYGDFGKRVRIPSLWIYSKNDHFFGPDLAQRMFAAFRNSGAPGELIIAPPYQRDGHNLIFGQPIWRDSVYDFLKRNHLPFAAPTLPPPPQASAAMAQAFADYLATPNYEKAFVIGPGGAYGWASGYNSADAALAAAKSQCEQHCDVVYAIDDTPAAAGGGSQAAAPPASSTTTTTPRASSAATTPAAAGGEMVRRLLESAR